MNAHRVQGLLKLAGMMAGVMLLGGVEAAPAIAQEPPPSLRLTTVASMNFTDSPRQYDLMQTLLELAPGAAVPSHIVNGRSIITVLSGEVSRVEENGETTVYQAGETFAETSGDHFDVDVNTGTGTARLLATFLLQPGAGPLIFSPNAAESDAAGPIFVAVARTTVGTIPAEFTLTHGMFDVPPGFEVGLHTHDGWSIVTELSGGHVANLVNGVEQAGATFVHGPHDLHEGSHAGPETVTAMFASIGPKGAPPSRPVTTGGTQPPAIQPPSTGDGGLLASR